MGSYDSWKLATPPEYEFLARPDPDEGNDLEECIYCERRIDPLKCEDEHCPLSFPIVPHPRFG